MPHPVPRRRFLSLVIALPAIASPRWLLAEMASELEPHREPHPEPRPGITAARLPSRELLAKHPDASPVFELVREIPQVVDGIRCHCGCAERAEFYSLLSCYEGADAMALACEVCQAQGRLAHRLHKAGRSLDEIRKGIDARFS